MLPSPQAPQTPSSVPVSLCRDVRSVSPTSHAPPTQSMRCEEFTFTVKVVASPFTESARGPLPVGLLCYDPTLHRVLLTNSSIYQPVFINHARVLSLEGVPLTSGCVVEVHPTPEALHSRRTWQGFTVNRAREKHSSFSSLSLPPSTKHLSVHNPSWLSGEFEFGKDKANSGSTVTANSPSYQSRIAKRVSFAQPEHTDNNSSSQSRRASEVPSGPALFTVPEASTGEWGSLTLLERPQRSATQKPSSVSGFDPDASFVADVSDTSGGARAAFQQQKSTARLAWHPAGANIFWAKADMAAQASPNATLASSLLAKACPPLDAASLSEPPPPSGSFITLSVRIPTPTESFVTDTRTAATVDTTQSVSPASASALPCEVVLSPVALFLADCFAVEEGTLVPRTTLDGHLMRAKSAPVAGQAATSAAQCRRFSSLMSDTILSHRTEKRLRKSAALFPPHNFEVPSSAREAGLRTLELLSTHFDSHSRQLRAFPPAEKRALYCHFLTMAQAHRDRLRHSRTVLRITSPVFCCGEVNGDFATLWATVLLRVCPFGHLPLLATPLLFTGNYLRERLVDVEESICALLALLAISSVFPVGIHLLRGRGEVFTEKRRATLRSQCATFFGSSGGKRAADAAIGLMSSLPIAAIVDEKVFVSHNGIPASPSSVSPDVAMTSPVRFSFDQVLAGVVPHNCFHVNLDDATPTFPHSSQAGFLRLVSELVGIRQHDQSSQTLTETHLNESSLLSPCTTTRRSSHDVVRLNLFLRRYGFSMAIHGAGGGDAGVRVIGNGRLVLLSTSPGTRRDGAPQRRGNGGGGCIINADTVQIVCWRTRLPSASNRNSLAFPSSTTGSASGGSPLTYPRHRARSWESESAARRCMSTMPTSSNPAVRYVMGVPLPAGCIHFFSQNPAAMLTPSRELPSPSSVRDCHNGGASLWTLSENGVIEYG